MAVAESLVGQNRLSIRNLVLEFPPKEDGVVFDPKHYLTEEDWREMMGVLEGYHDTSSMFAEVASELVLINPNILEVLRLDQYVHIWERNKQDLERYRINGEWRSFIECASYLKLLFPHRITQLGLDSLVWQGIRSELAARSYSNPEVFCDIAAHARIIFPQGVLALNFPDEVYLGMKSELEEDRSRGYWFGFAFSAMRLRLVFPSKVDSLGLDDNAWEGMITEMDKYRKPHEWYFLISHVKNMKLLATREIRITDRSVQVIMSPSFQEFIPALPARRKF